jgi:hypothetical protein
MPGHILLVVGYEHYVPNVSTPDFAVVTRDPYGRFDPSLLSRVFVRGAGRAVARSRAAPRRGRVRGCGLGSRA